MIQLVLLAGWDSTVLSIGRKKREEEKKKTRETRRRRKKKKRETIRTQFLIYGRINFRRRKHSTIAVFRGLKWIVCSL